MIFRRSVLLSAVLCLIVPAEAAFERLPQGPREAALGILSLPGSVILQKPLWEASVFIAPRLYGCDGLSYGGATAVLPWLSGLFTLAGTRFGSAAYREQVVSLGFFLPLSSGFAAGGIAHAYDLSITGYGRAGSFGVDAALAASLGDNATYYCSVLNLNAPTIGTVRERLPQALVSGFVIQPAHPVCLTIEFLKEVSNDLEFRAGAECMLSEAIGMRAGIAPSTAMYGAGCVIGYGTLSVEYALAGHRELGATHWFSVRWRSE